MATNYKIGDSYYNWIVLERGQKTGYLLCECQCEFHTQQELRKNKMVVNEAAKKCKKCREKERSLIGKHFGRLTVIEKDKNRKEPRHTYYLCKCECGNNTLISCRADKLISGNTKSCGCLSRGNINEDMPSILSKNIKGKIFGDWEVIRQVPKPDFDKQSGTWWELKCLKCGETKILKGIHITKERIGNCTQTIGSRGEQKIRNILKENKIPFQEQYKFLDLKPNGISYRFDFAIFNNTDKLIYLIEYQGEQHYHPVKYFGGEDGFKDRQKRDSLKKEYCENKKIPLIIIPYTIYEELTFKDLQLSTSSYVYDWR